MRLILRKFEKIKQAFIMKISKLYSLLILLTLIFSFSACDDDEGTTPDGSKTDEEVEVAEMTFSINHVASVTELDFNSEYQLASNEMVTFRRLAYLLSNFYLVKTDDSKVELTNQYAFVNFGQGKTTFTLDDIPMGDYKAIGFSLGLDSAINHGDPNQYEIDHPLAPLNNSLHWGWEGGYIFTAVEGKTLGEDSNSFSFHIAGTQNRLDYKFPLDFTKSSKALNANLKYDILEIFKSPTIYNISEDGRGIHSSDAPNATTLTMNMTDVFTLVSVNE